MVLIINVIRIFLYFSAYSGNYQGLLRVLRKFPKEIPESVVLALHIRAFWFGGLNMDK
jgi:hypothetical protein